MIQKKCDSCGQIFQAPTPGWWECPICGSPNHVPQPNYAPQPNYVPQSNYMPQQNHVPQRKSSSKGVIIGVCVGAVIFIITAVFFVAVALLDYCRNVKEDAESRVKVSIRTNGGDDKIDKYGIYRE